MDEFHEDWIIPSSASMKAIHDKVDDRRQRVIECEQKIAELGIITRSKRVQLVNLNSDLLEAKRRLALRLVMLDRYNNDFLIIKAQTEAFGWRYPIWAEWPRDADLFQREAFNAYNAKRDIISFGRVY